MMLNSYDEWSPLQEVIVGSPLNYLTHEIDFSFKLFSDEHVDFLQLDASGKKTITHRIKKQYLDELIEDVEGLVTTLKQLGVKVHRPTVCPRDITVKTPYWESSCIPALNLRDRAIILGDEILETPPVTRARYFETDLLKPVFYEYFNQGARWTVMPHPIMTDVSFDTSYVEDVSEEVHGHKVTYSQQKTHFDVGPEIMIDAAQCMRFGQDILVNVANENHDLGFRWLEKHLEGRFRLHRLYRLTDNHLDTFVVPLKPGVLMMRNPSYFDLLPEPLKKWDIIYSPEPDSTCFPNYEDDDLVLTSLFIDLNVLSLDEKRMIVNSCNPGVIKMLEKHGFEPIPVRHRHRRLFSGGFHCFTLDTVRAGKQEDYFSL